jgi:hypothetical protein
MIYEFSHSPTSAGRRVRFVIGRAELAQLRRTGLLASDALRDVEAIETGSPAEVMLVMPPHTARVLVDALETVGGDAAVAARMLATALDGMVHELRTERAIGDVIRVPRDVRRLSRIPS